MQFKLTTLLALTACLLSTTASSNLDIVRPVRFDHHQLVRIPRVDHLIDTAYNLNIDVWAKAKDYVDMRVAPGQLAALKKAMGGALPKETVLNANVQEMVDQETAMIKEQQARIAVEGVTATADYFTAYHRYDDTVAFLRDLAAKYPSLVSTPYSIGKSVEGRDIMQVKITSTKSPNANKKRVWLQGQQHAREWIAGITMMYVAFSLASKYGQDARITSLVDAMEFVITPMCNPDGVEYTWTTNRMWRKNRQVIGGQKTGVDTNRNWPDHWGKGGSSTSPSSDVYMGPSPGSEPEVKALMASFAGTPNVIVAVDFHSYSELVLRPYGWTQNNGPDDAVFSQLGQEIVKSIQSKGEHAYTNQRIVDLYVASGGASDWFYGDGTKKGANKNYGISIELPPSQQEGGWGQGFVLDAKRIIPVGESIVPAVLAMAEFAVAHPLGKQA